MAEVSPGLVTVFGGSGFIGSQAVQALARLGWRIRVAVRKPSLAFELRPLGDVGQIQLMRCDITSPEDVAAAVRGADAVINLVGVLYERPGRSFERIHVEGTRNIVEAALDAGVSRFVQVSAIGADSASGSAYARTKMDAETIVRSGFPGAVVLRPSVVFGSGDSFLNRFASMATLSPVLPLIGGGKTRFQPVYVGDVAEAIARAASLPSAAGRTFELGGPSVMTFREILEGILRQTNRRRLLAPVPFPIARMLGSLAQVTAVVGIAPALTRDQVVSLETDNVVSEGAEGLQALGVQPTGLEAIAPAYLWLYRDGGQFAASPAAA